MKLRLMSDLHLEFLRDEFQPAPVECDVVLLPGDIHAGDQGVQWAQAAFDVPVVTVSGNHEFYGKHLQTTARLQRNSAKTYPYVHYLENSEVEIQGVRFLGCTLWTDFLLYGNDYRQQAMRDARHYMNDFHLITFGPIGRFTPEQSIGLHEHSVQWLTEKLNTPFVGKTVVLTHHLPSMRSVHLRYVNDLLSAAFASNLDHLFDGSKVALWVHGHTHDSFDYRVNGTRVVCNPRGYRLASGRWENPDFNEQLVIEI